jgi:diadenosine tetraphosphate (Ap4A) HIT family hydrolase
VLPAFLLALLLADVRTCACDPAKPATLDVRECSLCKAAEQQPLTPAVFFLKDANPTKPNRTLALPRKHYPAAGALEDLPPADRDALWTAALAQAKSTWGDAWALAYNGSERRTQCHTHIHIGKLSEDAENDAFTVVEGPSAIPAPAPGTGMWVHPVAGKLHVHAGEQLNETVLVR